MRRERRKKGCISRMLTYFMYFFAAMIVITLISETTGGNSGDTSSRTADVEASVSDVPSTPESTTTPAPEATPEPETLQEWAEYVANSVYGSFDPKYSSLISVECEQVDGESAPMIIINAKYPDTFMRDNDNRMAASSTTPWKRRGS